MRRHDSDHPGATKPREKDTARRLAKEPAAPNVVTPRKQILIVDDHPMMRAGLTQLLNKQPGLQVCCEASTPAEAMEQLSRRRPDIILADLTLKGGSGLEFIKNVSSAYEGTPILVVSMHNEMLYAERVLHAGARGYIMKEESGEHLVTAVNQVLAGSIYVSQHLANRILQSLAGPGPHRGAARLSELTDREFEVFQLIGEGKTTRQIAEHLSLSPKTVDVHRAHIKEKLLLGSSAALVSYAVQWVNAESGASGRD